MTAVVGIVPAAGSAVRLQPLEGSKEMQNVRGRPVIDFLLDRLERAPCSEIRIVTRAPKADVIAHAHARGHRVITGEPPSVAHSIALALDGLDGEDVALIGFPDTIWQPEDGFAQLLAAVAPPVDAVLGLFGTEDLQRSDVVEVDEGGWVTSVQVKPPRPRSRLIWGCAASRVRALAGLEHVTEPGDHFDALAHRAAVLAKHLSNEWVDIGTPEALEAVGPRATP